MATENMVEIDLSSSRRHRVAPEGQAQRLQLTFGWLITELEINSTFRGAVELFNLCCNLDQKDILNAECIRTFVSQTVDGRHWMHRLEAFQSPSKMMDANIYT